MNTSIHHIIFLCEEYESDTAPKSYVWEDETINMDKLLELHFADLDECALMVLQSARFFWPSNVPMALDTVLQFNLIDRAVLVQLLTDNLLILDNGILRVAPNVPGGLIAPTQKSCSLYQERYMHSLFSALGKPSNDSDKILAACLLNATLTLITIIETAATVVTDDLPRNYNRAAYCCDILGDEQGKKYYEEKLRQLHRFL